MKTGNDSTDKLVGTTLLALASNAAMVDDYVTRMAKIQGISQDEILRDIQTQTQKKLQVLNTQLQSKINPVATKIKRELPDKPAKMETVRIPYIIKGCAKLKIDWNAAGFSSTKLLTQISLKDYELGRALSDYFSAFEDLRFCYWELKHLKDASINKFYELKKTAEEKQYTVDTLLK